MSKFWSQVIRQIEPYVPNEQPQIAGLIKLNTNESPYPPSPEVAKAIDTDAIEQLRLYPDPNATELSQAVADYYQLDLGQVFMGNGSDEVLAQLFMAFLQGRGTLLYRSEEHTSELQSRPHLVCRLLLAKKTGEGASG